MSDTPPPEDLSFTDQVAALALDTYAETASMAPFAVIGTARHAMIVPPSPLNDVDSKREFVNILRYLSIEHGGRRSAFAMEVWTMPSKDPKDLRLQDEIHARGGSLSEHPRAEEAVFVIVESDAGLTTRMHRIVRSSDNATLEAGETKFQPRSFPPVNRGMFSNFHIPTDFQSTPDAQGYAAEMRALYPGITMKIEPAKASRPN